MEEAELGRGERQDSALPPTSAELVVVRLQQGLGDVPWLTAGQVLSGTLLFWLTAAATAAATTTVTAAAWQVSIVLVSPL